MVRDGEESFPLLSCQGSTDGPQSEKVEAGKAWGLGSWERTPHRIKDSPFQVPKVNSDRVTLLSAVILDIA